MAAGFNCLSFGLYYDRAKYFNCIGVEVAQKENQWRDLVAVLNLQFPILQCLLVVHVD
jgi:hypothetical protein